MYGVKIRDKCVSAYVSKKLIMQINCTQPSDSMNIPKLKHNRDYLAFDGNLVEK